MINSGDVAFVLISSMLVFFMPRVLFTMKKTIDIVAENNIIKDNDDKISNKN